jgi:hypothetical protein
MDPFVDNIRQCVALSPFAHPSAVDTTNKVKSGSLATLVTLRKSKRQWSDLTKKDKLARIDAALLNHISDMNQVMLCSKLFSIFVLFKGSLTSVSGDSAFRAQLSPENWDFAQKLFLSTLATSLQAEDIF